MRSTDLTREQLEATEAVVLRMLRWHGRLRDRMDKLGFPPDDQLRAAVERAWEGVYSLRVAVHYAKMPGVVGERKGEGRTT